MAPKDLYSYLDECITLKKEFPHLIAGEYFCIPQSMDGLNACPLGYDLVGDENELRPVIDYIEPLLYFRKRQTQEGVEIPFLFHAGETLGDGSAADSNVYDAVLLGAKRIGHGSALRMIFPFRRIDVPVFDQVFSCKTPQTHSTLSRARHIIGDLSNFVSCALPKLPIH